LGKSFRGQDGAKKVGVETNKNGHELTAGDIFGGLFFFWSS
jgi:hypothetical protein